MKNMRIEQDQLGQKQISDDILYGIQTARAVENFHLEYKKTNIELIRAMITVKKATALTYQELKIGKVEVYKAEVSVCDKLLAQEWTPDFMAKTFATDALQGGAGTSTNMNVNEVISNLVLIELGYEPGQYDKVHPIDDINRGQSTNDVYPTALRIAAIRKLRMVSDFCAKLQESLQKKELEWENVSKLGRTELMDAVPITLGSEFGAYAQAIARDRWRLYKIEERLRQINLGGTAVGTGNNTDRKYRYGVIEKLRDLTDIGLAVAEYPMDITQNQDVFVETSGMLKALAVNLMKIANDLRLMNGGPRGGLAELQLEPLQMGSTIMPGKVNPVIPEMVMQVAMRVMANDSLISMAASHGEFELNAFLPVMADALLESLDLLEHVIPLFINKCIKTLVANPQRCQFLLENSFAFATAYTPVLGYDTVCRVINESGQDPKLAKQRMDALKKELGDL